MIYFQLEKAKALILPKRQTPSNWGTQSRWVLRNQDGRAAEESSKNLNPKVLPLGFLLGERKVKMREIRVYKENSLYYITVNASNNETLFRDESDYAYFTELLNNRKEKYNFQLHAASLLTSLFHLLIEPSRQANISKIMQAINTSYSLYYNNKYKRAGHLFSSRYKCELLNKDDSTLAFYKDLIEQQKTKAAQVPGKKNEKNGVRFIFSLNRTGIKNKSDPIFILILIAGLALSSHFLFSKSAKYHNKGKNFAKKAAQADFPRGLPIYSTVNKQERQVWELWKLGPQE